MKWQSPNSDQVQAPNIRNIKYSNADLADVIVSDKNDKAYGGVEVTKNMESVLTMNPKMMLYDKIDALGLEIEIEKGFTKCCYSQIQKDKDSNDAEEVNNEVLDLQAKTVNYGKIIAKDLPTIQSHSLQ